MSSIKWEHCKNCFMPTTKPGLKLDDKGICPACRHAKRKNEVDWSARFDELKNLCDKYRRNDGYYDSLIAVSGGKDSTFQVYVFKELLGMNPLLVAVGDTYEHTKAGIHNIKNIAETFNCDMVQLHLSPDFVRRMIRITTEELFNSDWAVDRAIYAYPIKLGIQMGIPLIVYGENVAIEYGGVQYEETYSAKDQIKNDVAKEVDFSMFYERGVKEEEMNMLKYPTPEEIDNAKLEPIYLSYFINWDGHRNYEVAKRRGLKDVKHEWNREGFIEHYDQVDSIGYLIGVWMKYPKFGFARATDVVGYWIRSGRITRAEGLKLIKENDHQLDSRALEDFLTVTGYTQKEFWDIAEKYWNTDLFERDQWGTWTLKEPVWEKEEFKHLVGE